MDRGYCNGKSPGAILDGSCLDGSCDFDETKSHGVHAVTKSCWLWTVVKDVPLMGFAAAAANFSSRHAERKIADLMDVFLCNRLPEAGPSCAGLEFGIGTEERSVAADAAIKAFVMQVPILP